MKTAFITHAIGFGGAAISSSKTIRFLLDKNILHPQDCVLIHIPHRIPSNENNDAYYSLKQQIPFFEWRLPWSHVDQISGKPSIIIKLYSIVKNLEALFFFLSVYNGILQREKIQVVHLNSIVLWPVLLVLPKNIQGIIHVREGFLDTIEAKIAQRIIAKKASAIICIDEYCAIPFSKNQKTSIILNPFNMTEARSLKQSKTDIKKQLNLTEDSFVISIIGRIEVNKGQHLISTFVDKIRSDKIVFLVVGSPNGKFGKKTIEALRQYPNVKILGQRNDMNQIYAVTDIVLRLDLIDYLPIGRTVWEGLFSGCYAVLPVKKGYELSPIQDLLNKYIFIYDYANPNDLVKTLNTLMTQCSESSDCGYPLSDNTEQSAIAFYHILQKICGD